ncbi:MAG: hypothetical protein ABJB12_14990 [Pseudomonadota bacterium]
MKNDSDSGQPSAADSDSIRAHVQRACLAGFTGIARVTIVGDIGYWFFRRGVICHAMTVDLTGDDAALRMLSWEACDWQPCVRPWPSERSVFLSWVELFQRAGELPRARAPLRSVAPQPLPPPRLSSPAPTFANLTPRFFSTPVPAAAPPRRPLSSAQLESLAGAATDCWVLEANGSSRTLRGESGVLSELAGFASQLCDRIGALVGAGRCLAFEAAYSEHTLLVANNGSNTVALTVAHGSELGWVKEQLRL